MGLLRSFERMVDNVIRDLTTDLRWWLYRGIIFFVALFLTLASGTESRDYDEILIARWPNWFTHLHPVFLGGVAITAMVLAFCWRRFSTGHLLFAVGMAEAQLILLEGQPHQSSSVIAVLVVYLAVLFTILIRRPAGSVHQPSP